MDFKSVFKPVKGMLILISHSLSMHAQKGVEPHCWQSHCVVSLSKTLYWLLSTGSIPEDLSSWVKVFRIIPEFRLLRLTFHRKSAPKS